MKKRGGKGKGQGKEQPKGTWLLTFNDLLTLVLSFFVLVLSLSRVGAPQLRAMSSSVRSAFGMTEGSPRVFDPTFVGSFRDQVIEAERERKSALGEEELLRAVSGLEGIEVRKTPGGITLSIEEAVLFTRGSGDITSGDHATLRALGKALRKTEAPIRMEGHTDDTLARGPYSSSWELSASRAIHMVKYLIEEEGIAPSRLSAVGYGDVKPTVPIGSEGAGKKNRRLDVVVRFQEG